MKSLTLLAALALTPVLALAQSGGSAEKASARPATPKSNSSAKTAERPKAQESVRQAAAKPAARTETSSRTQLRSAANQVATGIIAAEEALSPEELAIAERVHVGRIACELGQFVTVSADPAAPGRFSVEGKGFKYRMSPVATTTGAIRLEDPRGGAVWLQIANKSMLMDQKRGQRLADECMSAEQTVVAEALKKNPPPSVLDAAPNPR